MARSARDSWLSIVEGSKDYVGDCAEWKGAMHGKTPRIHVPADVLYPGSRKGTHTVRSALWSIKFGEPFPNGFVVRMRCMNDCCIADEHMRLVPRQQQAQEQARRGELRTVRSSISRISARRARSVLTVENVQEIRSSAESIDELAKRFGVSKWTIRSILSHRTWADVASNASVFAWRPAA